MKIGKYNIHYKEWKIDRPKANIFIVHGLGEHIGRYHNVAKKLNAFGFNVFGWDHIGHGRSDGQRGHIPSYELFYTEILTANKISNGNLPVILYGHSMGGNIVLNFILDHSEFKLEGAIVTSPHLRLTNSPNPFLMALGKTMNVFWPSFSKPNGIDPGTITSNNTEMDNYVNDPLVHDRISARMGMSLLQMGDRLHHFSGSFPIPLLLMHGEKDAICDPDANKQFVDRLQGDLESRFFPGGFHELHHEKDHIRHAFFDTIDAWLVRKFP